MQGLGWSKGGICDGNLYLNYGVPIIVNTANGAAYVGARNNENTFEEDRTNFFIWLACPVEHI